VCSSDLDMNFDVRDVLQLITKSEILLYLQIQADC
jgi:hypothetical protein